MAINQLNLPAIYGAAEQVKGQRIQNQLYQAESERRGRVSALMPRAVAGDQAAIDEMYSDNPEWASKLDDRQRANARQNIEATGRLLYSVEQAPEAQRPQVYQAARAQAQEWGMDVSKIPENYDPQYVRFAMGRLLKVDKMLEAGKPQSPLGKLKTDFDAGLITSEQYSAAVTKANAPRGALVEITTPGQTIDDRLLDMDLKTIAGTEEAVKAGADFMPRLEVIVQGLESGNVETGRFQEATLPFLQFAQSIGWYHDPKLGQKEAVLAAISYMIPRMRVVGSGQTSDVEIKLFSQATAQYSNTPEGNILIARGMMQIQRRNKQLLAAQRVWVRKNKTLEGFDADKELGPMFPKVATQADLDKLDSGTVFIMKDGSEEDGMFVVKD